MNTTPDTPQVEEARFAFGKNWQNFLSVVDDERLEQARISMQAMLQEDSLAGQSFLDIGCGSGLFSLVAAELGAEPVHSFDFDFDSVMCGEDLRRRHGLDKAEWTVEQGDVLDRGYVDSLDKADIVYSWGVLHHTGNLFQALENAASLVAPGGRLCVAIYNDQGRSSQRWAQIKRTYNNLPPGLQTPFVIGVMGPLEARSALRSLIRLEPGKYVRAWTDYKQSRGMSRWHDLVDWCGGYPFEVSTPDRVLDFLHERGFELIKLQTRLGGWGCNEFVFARKLEP